MPRTVSGRSVTAFVMALVAVDGPIAEDSRRLLSGQELIDLGDKSSVSYRTKVVKDPTKLPAPWNVESVAIEAPARLPYPAIEVQPDGSRTLVSFECTPSAMSALERAEPLFQRKEYDSARTIYEAALTEDYRCYLLHLNIGDCYLFSGEPDRALSLYDHAVELNPVDFHGHWFRASALVALHRSAAARLAYSQALALAPRNPELLGAIRSYAKELGIEVRDEPFRPLAVARPEKDGVTVYTVDPPYWWVYGMCRAIWLAEEPHRMQITGRTRHTWSPEEELECLGALLSQYERFRNDGETRPEPQLDTLLDIRDHRLLEAFVWYEHGSQVPELMLLVPDGIRNDVVELARNYLLVDARSPAAP